MRIAACSLALQLDPLDVVLRLGAAYELRYVEFRREELERELLLLLAMTNEGADTSWPLFVALKNGASLPTEAWVGMAQKLSANAAAATTEGEILNTAGRPEWYDRSIISIIAKT